MQLFYTVQPGDTVYLIARRWMLPTESLIAANNLAPPYTIYIGQQLSVPPGVPYYVVQRGDTLYQLARRFNVTTSGQNNFERIREVNRLPSYDLIHGMKLIIPYAPPGDHGIIAYISVYGMKGKDFLRRECRP